MSRRLPALLLLPACVLACGKQGDALLATDVREVRVEPEGAELVVRPGEPAELDFTAWATFKDGSVAELDLVSWSSSNLSAGDIDSLGHFTTTDTNGGVTDIVATHLDLSSSATVRVVYTDDIVEDGVDEAVVAAFEASSPTEDADLRMRYPPVGAAVPRNLEGLGFLWPLPDDQPVASTVSRLRLRTDITDVSVYVQGNSWIASSDLFALVTASNRGGEITVQVESGTWEDGSLGPVVAGQETSMTINRFDARGSVFYWESNDEAIMRIPFGSRTPEEFWTAEDSGGQCTGCHVVSKAADLMAVTHNGVDGRFTVIDVSDPDDLAVVVPPQDDARTTFSTVSPDGRVMIGSNLRQLTVFDLDTGSELAVFEHDLPLTQPDFSPDGDAVVAVRVTGQWNSDFQFLGGELVRLPWDGEELGEPELILPADPDWNYYYPAWSPDGDWIAFNRSTEFGYSSDKAQLMLVSADGGEPVVLERANGVGELRNSYPRWGPLPDDDILWLAYSSLRTYALDDTDLPQIWVTSVDTTAAAAGEDPSTAPFWLPGQDPRSDNHLPAWWDE